MEGQISLFDILEPDRFDPMKAPVSMASPYWTTSRQTIIEEVNKGAGTDAMAEVVKEEYCPYGYSGGYRNDYIPNTIDEWTFKTNKIHVEWTDAAGQQQKQDFSYKDFARAVIDLVLEGRYVKNE